MADDTLLKLATVEELCKELARRHPAGGFVTFQLPPRDKKTQGCYHYLHAWGLKTIVLGLSHLAEMYFASEMLRQIDGQEPRTDL